MKSFKFILPFLALAGLLLGNCRGTEAQTYPAGYNKTNNSYISSTTVLKSNHIPIAVFKIRSLKTLIISGEDCDTGIHDDNKPGDGINCWMIKEIPKEIGNLPNLDTLSLTLGAFGRLPDEISSLKNLRYLDLTDTYLSNIDNLTSLTNLDHLLLYGCGLSKLPGNIGDLKKLRFLGLAGNNLDEKEITRISKALPDCKIYFH